MRTIAFGLLVLFLSAAASAQDLEIAKKLERDGKNNDAVAAYEKWLSTNGRNEDFKTVLFHAVSLVRDVSSAADLLTRSLSFDIPPSVRVDVLEYLAQLEELSGRLSDAQKHYEEASYAEPGKKDYGSLLSSAGALFSLGDPEGAETRARAILLTCDDQEIVRGAVILYARIFSTRREYARGAESLEKIRRTGYENPSLLYLLGWLYTKDGKENEAGSVFSRLRSEFPESPEAGLIPGNTEYAALELYPEPSLLFEFLPDRAAESAAPKTAEPSPNVRTAPSTPGEGERQSLQTGSFLKRDNAEEMVERLGRMGFRAEIREVSVKGKTYYRVEVPVAGTVEDARKIMMDLKDRGMESYLIFDRTGN